ncbi:diacylglycerol cholinephosphotransferase Mf1 [Mycoplasma crocodyli]|uniref:LicD/FKTN/FKRP nucleotidyltransferase domain-containing protein n=1 Tax=Mycoplasma crocodyli (strain ATCC 51981 / MP145) TaxID=512564 RepID=D5E5H1_MYCCM|nr:LicD family protein [Mycoplasma crocodyli]ADE19656.1 hypothetical protein MCRO_0379 [Mycoplasma crocodyli MP145]
MDVKTKNKQKELLKIFDEFLLICNKNNLFYSLAYGTLLGAYRKEKMIEWDEDMDLLIDEKTYDFLKINHPDNIIYKPEENNPYPIPKFVIKKDEFNIDAASIDLFVITKSTMKQLNKYCNSPFIKIRAFKASMNRNVFFKYKKLSKVLSFLCNLFFFWSKKLTTDEAIKYLNRTKQEKDTYFITCWPKNSYKKQNILHNEKINELKVITFENRSVKCIGNVEELLEQWYGKDFRVEKKDNKTKFYGYYELWKK